MSTLAGWLNLAAALALGGILVITLVNLMTLPRLGQGPDEGRRPRLSVLIPARDEAATIEATLRGLLAQADDLLEIIVLDDQSSDHTAGIVARLAAVEPRLRLAVGQPLPPGWLGKNWACHQLAAMARGEILIFADADVHWSPGAIAAVVGEMAATGADLLGVWPTQVTVTRAERLVVPLMAFVVLGYLPWPLVHHSRFALFAAANGQCLAFRRAVYSRVGGHEAVRAEVLEDVALARRSKRVGLKLRLAVGRGLVSCRMYRDWGQVRRGFGKNILAGYGDRMAGLVLATLFHWLILLWPWVWLGRSLASSDGTGIAVALGLIGAGFGARGLTAWMTRQRVLDAAWLPASALLMSVIAGQALWWRWQGGPIWKGRRAVVGRAGGAA